MDPPGGGEAVEVAEGEEGEGRLQLADDDRDDDQQ